MSKVAHSKVDVLHLAPHVSQRSLKSCRAATDQHTLAHMNGISQPEARNNRCPPAKSPDTLFDAKMYNFTSS